MSSLAVPHVPLPSSSPQPMDGVSIPPPSGSPPVPDTAPMEDVATSSTTLNRAVSTGSLSEEMTDEVGVKPNRAPLTADEERIQFAKFYTSQLQKDDEYAVIPMKWFESWMAYSGFDRQEADNAPFNSPPPTAAAASSSSSNMDDGPTATAVSSSRRFTEERPGRIDCSTLLETPPANADLTNLHWIELRHDAQEGVDFTTINHQAMMRLSEWYGAGPLIIRKVVELGLSQVPTIELHPQHLILTPISRVDGRIQIENRRIKTFPKSMLVSELITACQPKDLSPEELPLIEGRIWTKRTKPLDPNVAKDLGLPETKEGQPSLPPTNGVNPSALRAATQTPAEFIREWEVLSKTALPQKLEFLELERGTEWMIEYRLNTEPWKRVGNGLDNSVHSWQDLRVGDILDCCDTELKWYQGEVQQLTNDPVKGLLAKIHFLNWSIKYDELIPVQPASFTSPYQAKVTRFAEKHSWTNHPHVPQPPKKKVEQDPYAYHSSFQRQNSVGPPDVRGAVGLRNLGNTCFMNSTLQCLANTPGLTEFFTDGKYVKYLNRKNPLGFQGKIAEEYGAMLKEIWSGQFSTVTPRGIKQVIGEFNPRFSGYAQQDSSELLSFLLDGLHEDLNRVLDKPQTKPVDSNGRPDAIVAQESWERHLQRNQSVVVDTFQGQLKSCVVCPTCNRQSITFDPFMFLSVPLPVPNSRLLNVIVVQSDAPASLSGSIAPNIWPMKIPKDGITMDELRAEVRDMINQAPKNTPGISPVPIETNCLLATEIYQSKIFKVLAANFSTTHIGKQDTIVFYHVPELAKNVEQHQETITSLQCIHQTMRYHRFERIGFPMVLPLPTSEMDKMKMKDLRALVRRALNPWWNKGKGWNEDVDVESQLYNIVLTDRSTDSVIEVLPYELNGSEDIEINITEKANTYHTSHRTGGNGMAFAIQWKLTFEQLQERLLQDPRDLTYPGYILEAEKNQPKKDGLDLGDCLEAFSKEETLRKTDAWYCSHCKAHKEATKKFDLWRVPDILIIHLKRFTYNTYSRDKIDSLVHFPLENLDLTRFIANEEDKKPANALYDLYAVSNHYGGMGGGHYTALAKNLVNKQWYNLDDSSASRIAAGSNIVTPAAYVLFYRRKAAKFTSL